MADSNTLQRINVLESQGNIDTPSFKQYERVVCRSGLRPGRTTCPALMCDLGSISARGGTLSQVEQLLDFIQDSGNRRSDLGSPQPTHSASYQLIGKPHLGQRQRSCSYSAHFCTPISRIFSRFGRYSLR